MNVTQQIIDDVLLGHLHRSDSSEPSRGLEMNLHADVAVGAYPLIHLAVVRLNLAHHRLPRRRTAATAEQHSAFRAGAPSQEQHILQAAMLWRHPQNNLLVRIHVPEANTLCGHRPGMTIGQTAHLHRVSTDSL